MNEQLKPSRLPVAPSLMKEFQIGAPEWRVLVEQIFPGARSVESVMMALAYCRSRKLDVFKKPVHIVPMWSSSQGKMVETVWPGISEIRTTAARTQDYAGIDEVEFGPEITRVFNGQVREDGKWVDAQKTVTFPEWARVTVYRLDRRGEPRAYRAKIFWTETYATTGRGDLPNEMWENRSYGQLDKCVEAAALRKAFPEELGNTYAAEEMEGKTIDITPLVETAPPTPPPAPPPSQDFKREPKPARTPPKPRDRSGTPYHQMGREAARESPEPATDESPAFDPDIWLDELSEALQACKDLHTLEEVWSVYGAEKIEAGLVMPPDQTKAEHLHERHHERIQGAMDARAKKKG